MSRAPSPPARVLPSAQPVHGLFGHPPGTDVRFTAVPDVETTFSGVEQDQDGPRAQAGAVALHLQQRGLRLGFAANAEQPPTFWRARKNETTPDRAWSTLERTGSPWWRTKGFTPCVARVVAAALVDDQATLEELQEARRLFPLTHQHLQTSTFPGCRTSIAVNDGKCF